MNKILSFLFLFLFVHVVSISAQSRSVEPTKYWVFFKDKKVSTKLRSFDTFEVAKSNISPRALKRRAKVTASSYLIDKHDLPVSRDYLQKLQSLGYKPLVISNWLNSVSIRLNTSELNTIKKLPFVKEVRPVGRLVREPLPTYLKPGASGELLNHQHTHTFNYGPSLTQNELINVPAVHKLGITAKGIWIGMLDSGFKYHEHEAFLNLDVRAEFDFINKDPITEDEEGQDQPGQHNHGTRTLSTVAGFQEGQLIGPAFDATFLLAKTEDITREIPQEEDNWVAGIEWLENLGVDIVSSSLGYIDFYSTPDMDGNTAVTTRAADIAVSKGVIVVNSAGNEANSEWQIVIAPADGDSVIAVGAVSSQNQLASFSSLGPTADGRTKPDVVAMGISVYTASPSENVLNSTYSFSNGTSFSCPSVAGVAALVLSAHPELKPMQVRDALRMTADRAANPDNQYGWGLVNAYEAVLFHGIVFSTLPTVFVNMRGNVEVVIKIDSKFGIDPNQVSLIYARSDGNFNNEVSMGQGFEEKQYVAALPDIAGGEIIQFYFRSADSSGAVAVHPSNAPDTTFTFPELPVSVEAETSKIPKRFHLAQNYPNPFNPSTKIAYDLPNESEVSLIILNLLGQRVKVLLQNTLVSAGQHELTWDSKDESGNLVSAGVYFYKLSTSQFTEIKKMLLIR